MAVQSLISVEEYLKTVYRPDRDYVDGSVEERNLGERDHSRLTAQIVVWFYSLETEKNIRVYPEQRVQVSPTKFRVPDICITDGEPKEQILTQPPLLCIEILSPEDRLERVLVRIEEFLAFGVPEVWVIAPGPLTSWRFTRQHKFYNLTGDVLIMLDGRLELDLRKATQR
ncbi:MAG TPA: Uma2 family endonuclease [Bryobacteraceae bacterium]|nr:Uma2 family endonuclease [Bryobacteraceae bacterium]